MYVMKYLKTYILEESCMTTSTSGFKPMQVNCVCIIKEVVKLIYVFLIFNCIYLVQSTKYFEDCVIQLERNRRKIKIKSLIRRFDLI